MLCQMVLENDGIQQTLSNDDGMHSIAVEGLLAGFKF